ncbi:HNH endonuclease [Ideonella sp.]|uniref:HNH endonuclease n=1 Tax=Ideonella sp. TaxID=1929293 RepID=UPI0035B09616
MRYWWVNQNQTYQHEVPGGYLWSPKTIKGGRRHYFYDTMTQALPGDVVFSFSDTYIRAIGVVQTAVATAPRPTEFGSAGAVWADEGWFLAVEFTELTSPIRPKEHIALLRPLLPGHYSPLQANGNGNQVVYLTELPDPLASALAKLIGPEFESAVKRGQSTDRDAEDDQAERVLEARKDISATQKLQLTKARRGQGLFRSRVELIESACRLTGVAEHSHLRASHIKPWRMATDSEKLDGNNGLMLAPHIDHLFDQGFISFADEGGLLVSPQLSDAIQSAWSVSQPAVPKPFNALQRVYLDFHRRTIYRAL